MPDVLIGCPVWMRGWVLPEYFAGVEIACANAGVIPRFLFVTDPRDVDTQAVINGYSKALHREVSFVWIEEVRDEDRRTWNDARYHRMVYLRNLLLRGVRTEHPDMFLSLDSDIILHPLAVVGMINGLTEYDATGGKCYMTIGGRDYPSMGYIDVNGFFYRHDVDYLCPVDVIMAIKMMSPLAYNIDYEWHTKGEDLGWSAACRHAGLRLGFDGRYPSKHVMEEALLHEIDMRCGF